MEQAKRQEDALKVKHIKPVIEQVVIPRQPKPKKVKVYYAPEDVRRWKAMIYCKQNQLKYHGSVPYVDMPPHLANIFKK